MSGEEDNITFLVKIDIGHGLVDEHVGVFVNEKDAALAAGELFLNYCFGYHELFIYTNLTYFTFSWALFLFFTNTISFKSLF